MSGNPIRWSRIAILIGGILLGGLWITPEAQAANERALWGLWNLHTNNPEDHQAVLTACKQFISANREDDLVPVVKTIASWHFFQLKKNDAATTLLTPYLEGATGAVGRGAEWVARGWLTRVDRERVREALQGYYRKEVQYPESMAVLKAHPDVPGLETVPDTDRWGDRWRYQLSGMKGLPNLVGQAYVLESRRLASTSDLAAAKALPYGQHIRVQPVRVISSGSAPQIVQFSKAGERGSAVGIAVGDALDDLYVAYAGQFIVIVCDYNHVMVFKKP